MTQMGNDHSHTFFQDMPTGLHQCGCGQYAMTVHFTNDAGHLDEGLQLINDPSEMDAHPS
jgi:hypothetical protein